MGRVTMVASYLVRWLPFPLLAAVCVDRLGWWRAGVVVLICLVLRSHWIVATILSAVAIFVFHIPFGYVAWAVGYRLVWDAGWKAVFKALDRRGVRPEPVVPGLRCHHGLQEQLTAADGLLRYGYGSVATDAYLKLLADHPVEPTCGRPLLLRAAEAACTARNYTLSAELSSAALRGVPPEPTGQLATMAVRAHATRARALLGLGDLAGATASLRLAQRTTQSNRPTEKYLRWTAVDVHLAGRPVRTTDELAAELGGALTQQHLNLRDPRQLHLRQVRLAWRVLEAGDPAGARSVFTSVVVDLGLDPGTRQIRNSQGHVKIPLNHQSSWRMFLEATAGMVAAASEQRIELSAEEAKAADVAADLAWFFDEPMIRARLACSRAILDRRFGDGGEEVVARLRRAEEAADYGSHVFTDLRLQSEWIGVRKAVRAALATSGVQVPPVDCAWPATLAARERAAKATAEATVLFDRLAAADPDAFGPARHRLANPLRQELDRAASPARPGPSTREPSEPKSAPTEVRRESKKNPARPPVVRIPDPPWLDALMTEAGGRCWTLPLAVAEARALGHAHVGPEHLLVAALRDGGCAHVMASLGAPVSAVQGTVQSWYSRAVVVDLAVDPAVRPLLRSAALAARSADGARIRPEHLLLAVLTTPDGLGTAVLDALGVDLGEARVRVAADLIGPAREAEMGGLFDAGMVVHEHRLTLPAWLAIGYALDLAAVEPAGVLGTRHLIAGVEAQSGPGRPMTVAGDRGAVRVSPVGRRALIAARLAADADAHWGIDLDHLCRAVSGRGQADAPAPDDTMRAVIRSACVAASRQGSRFVDPDDIRAAMDASDAHGDVDSPVPVLTPQARRLLQEIREGERTAA